MKGPPIDGAVVVITGASSGIGRELAREVAAGKGHNLGPPRLRVFVCFSLGLHKRGPSLGSNLQVPTRVVGQRARGHRGAGRPLREAKSIVLWSRTRFLQPRGSSTDDSLSPIASRCGAL